MFMRVAICLLLGAFVSECNAYITVNEERCSVGDFESPYPHCPDFVDENGDCMIEDMMFTLEDCVEIYGQTFYDDLPQAAYEDEVQH